MSTLRVSTEPLFPGEVRLLLSTRLADGRIQYAATRVDLRNLQFDLPEVALLDAVSRLEHQLGVEV